MPILFDCKLIINIENDELSIVCLYKSRENQFHLIGNKEYLINPWENVSGTYFQLNGLYKH